jgi:uncharacterized protein (DUF924 family)
MPDRAAKPLESMVDFWRKAGPTRWFASNASFDAQFRLHYLAAHESAARGELDRLAETPRRALGLVLLLDQFPRNAFRGEARMYATDEAARQQADRAISRGFDRELRIDTGDAELRHFFYLPFMHSENLADQARSLALNAPLGNDSARFAAHHHGIVARFGRFPHRNAVLGRTSTPEELAFLAAGGFGG